MCTFSDFLELQTTKRSYCFECVGLYQVDLSTATIQIFSGVHCVEWHLVALVRMLVDADSVNSDRRAQVCPAELLADAGENNLCVATWF